MFDPNKHMAMFKVKKKDILQQLNQTDGENAVEANTVHSVTKVGYLLHDRVVRPAEVGVVLGDDGE